MPSKTKRTNESVIEDFKEIHGDSYNYSLVSYENNTSKLTIICPIHGEFKMSYKKHVNRKQGCKKCGIVKRSENRTLGFQDWINKFRKVHGDLYIYPNQNIVNGLTPIRIICKEHGEFWQKPSIHVDGCGCQNCGKKYSKGEETIKEILTKYCIKYKRQFTFSECKHQQVLQFDFYLPFLNILIEYNGEQHYRPIKYWGGCQEYIKRLRRDQIKRDFCSSNDLKLIEITYTEYNSIEEILVKELGLCQID